MRVLDFFRMNEWQTKKFNSLILSILLAYDVVFLTNNFLFKIPILPQLLGFVILTFIPGFIILRIIKIHNINRAINFLLAVGLSLSFIMLFGCFVNTLLPYVGISKPISSFTLFYAFNIAILTLLFVSHFGDKSKTSQDFLDINISLITLFSLLLPSLSVFGAYIMNFYNSNILLLFILFLVSLIPIMIAYDKIPKNLYPLLIFVVSLSILYHINLISTHLWSFDIFFEFYSANLVVEKGIWEPSLDYGPHSILITTILAPSYSLLCDLNLVWVFKMIFPFLFSLTPVVLYKLYEGFDFGDYKFNCKLALLSAFVFVFYYGFFKDMPDKQHIAELFLALVLMLIVTKIPCRNAMVMIFSFSLITSHMGVSYVFMLSSIFALFLYIVRKERERSLLTQNFVLFFSAFAISWYMYVASGVLFENVVYIGYHILSKISEILQPEARSGVTYAFYGTPTTMWFVYKVIHILLQFFITIGIMKLLISFFKKEIKSRDLSLLSIAFYCLLLSQITTTYGLGFDRVLQITLVLLSPIALIGCNFAFKVIKKMVNYKKDLKVNFPSSPTKFFAIFLMIFSLFNSGFVFEVTNDLVPPYAIALNRSTWEVWNVFNQSEVNSAMWLKEHSVNDKVSSLTRTISKHACAHVINASAHVSKDGMVLSEYYRHIDDFVYFDHDTTSLPSGILIYLGNLAAKKGMIPYWTEGGVKYVRLNETTFYNKVLARSCKVFDDGGSSVYYVP